MNIGVSPLTNTIFIGKSKKLKNGVFEWVGEKHDITDDAIRAVFEWFMNNYKNNEQNKAYEIRYTNCPYVLTMTLDKDGDNDD